MAADRSLWSLDDYHAVLRFYHTARAAYFHAKTERIVARVMGIIRMHNRTRSDAWWFA